MAEIKLYGNAVNGDGKYIISPFDIAAPKADGKTAYTDDDKADNKNIVSYINSKVGSLTSVIGAVKPGIQSASFVAPTLSPNVGGSTTTELTITAKDGSTAKSKLTIGLPSADTIVTGANSYINLIKEFKSLQNSYSTLNTTVTAINGSDTGYRKGDKDTLKSANEYTDKQITGALGTVYKVKGTKSLTEIKALTDVKEGDVYNVSNDFLIDGKHYSEYTNIVFLADSSSVVYNDKTGFGGAQVDALGGVQDLSDYSLNAETVKNISVTVPTDTTLSADDKVIGRAIFIRGNDSTTMEIKAKLPGNLVKSKSTAYLKSNNHQLSLYTGLTDLSDSAIHVRQLSYQDVSTSISFSTSTSSDSPAMHIAAKGELGTTYTVWYTIPTISPDNYGFAAAGKGINVNNGVISIPENGFSTSKYLSISYITNEDNGKDFLLDIVCSSKGSADVIPLQKCDSTTLGIKIEAGHGTEDILLLQKDNRLALKADKLIGKVDTNTTNITSLEKRVAALETLLSLA